ncbi:hypothetical protein M9458_044227, partial [Cirrhinus mrigala]
MDNLRDQISLALLKLNNSDLFPVCRHLKCDEPVGGFENRTRRALIRIVEKKLDDIEETEDKEVFLQCLEDLLSLIDSLIQSTKAASSITPDEPNELDMLKEKYSRLQMEQAQARQTLEGEIVAMEQRLREETRAATVTLPALPEVTLRREFRISGQIGEARQREKLSYTSLMNQMESGLRKGHSETEIIEAVTRAVSPGLHLRDMLEIKRDLTLPTLKTILRGHYKVDPPSDLLQKLMNITQDPKESAQNFLFRGIELREKLLWKLSEEDEGEQFSPELIQRKFLRSIETGLLSEAVKLQLKPYLSNPRIKDEELIERVNEASNLEQERQQKLKKNAMSKSPRLSEIQTNICPLESQLHSRSYMDPKSNDSSPAVKADSTSISKNSQVKQKEADPSMSQLIEQLRAEVLEMKRMVNETMETAKAKGRTERVIPVNASRLQGCRACQEARAGEQCNHCFRCGEEGHLSRGCRRPREQQGNGRGLLRRDPQ